MHDYDSEFVWDYEYSCHDYIEESNSYESNYDLSNEERMAGKYVEWDEELYQSDNTKGWSIFDKTKPFPNDGPKIRRKDV